MFARLSRRCRLLGVLGVLGVAELVTACNPTRHLQPGEQWLEKQPNLQGAHHLDQEALKGAIRTKANRRLLWTPIYLQAWNLGQDLKRDNLWWKVPYRVFDTDDYFLDQVAEVLQENLGEEPLVLDSAQLERDTRALERVAFSRGFFHATADYRVQNRRYQPERVRVTFNIDEGPGYRIRKVFRDVPDLDMLRALKLDPAPSRLQAGELYNERNLSEERQRIAEAMRRQGYYSFTPEAVTFLVDTLLEDTTPPPPPPGWAKRTLIKLGLGTPPLHTRPLNVTVEVPQGPQTYTIRNVRLTVAKQLVDLLPDSAFYLLYGPTLDAQARTQLGLSPRRLSGQVPLTFKVQQSALGQLNFNTLAQRVTLRPGDRYNVDEVRRTQRQLGQLNLFKAVSVKQTGDDSLKVVDVEIEMPLLKQHSFNFGVETFASEDLTLNSNLPSFGARVSFQRRNAFRRAELLNLELNGTFSFYQPLPGEAGRFFFQYGGRLNITFPRMLFLDSYLDKEGELRTSRFFRPQTILSILHERENRQEFERNTTGFDLSWDWAHGRHSDQYRSRFSPLSITIVNSRLDNTFYNRLFDKDIYDGTTVDTSLLTTEEIGLFTFISNDFRPRFSSRAQYSFTWNEDYGQSRRRLTWWVRATAELGGNLAFLYDWLGQQAGFGDGNIRDGLLNNNALYGQYAKLVVEAKWFRPIYPPAEAIFRVRGGVTSGWNYTQQVPLENRFFTGGISTVRGWFSNTLGPGTYSDKISNVAPYGGEVLLEMNAELRHDLVSFLEGALFVDAGNVWFTSSSSFSGEGAVLTWDNFRLGVSAGIGLRVDLSFLIMRLDVAQQLYAPDLQQWVVRSWRDLGGDRLQWNIGIGYPF